MLYATLARLKRLLVHPPALLAAPDSRHLNTLTLPSRPWETIEVMITLGCPLSCYHCISNSGPNRGETMSEADLVALIQSIADFGRTRYVCLMGGEPMREPKLLAAGLKAILGHGMLPSVVTSAWFASSAEEARRRLESLRGIELLIISTDRAHASQVGNDVVLRAARAARDLGIPTTINYAAEADEFDRPESLPADLRRAVEQEGIHLVVTPILESGRAARRPHIVAALPADRPCAQLHIPLVHPSGDVFACCSGWTIPAEGRSPHRLGTFPEQSIGELFARAYASEILGCIRDRSPMEQLRRAAGDDPARLAEIAANPPKTPCGACQMLARWNGDGAEYWTNAEPAADSAAAGSMPLASTV